MHAAMCPNCKRSYQVPELGKKYRCKNCGKSFVAQADQTTVEEEKAASVERTCPVCQAIITAKGSAFCDACGSPLDHGKEDKTAKGMTRSPSDEIEKKMATREVRRVVRLMTGVRGLFICNAIIMGLFFLMALFNVDSEARGLMLTVSGVFFLVMLLGTRQVTVQPFFWSLLAASLWTVSLIPILFSNNLIYDGYFISITIFLWGAVAAALNMRKLIRKHPNIQINRRLVVENGVFKRVKPEKRAGSPGETTTRRKAREKTASRIHRKRLVFIGCTLVVLTVGVYAVIQLNKPPGIEKRTAQFAEKWNDDKRVDSILSDLSSFYRAEYRDKMQDAVRQSFEKYGFSQGLPKIGPPQVIKKSKTSANVDFAVSLPEVNDPLTTYWSVDDYGNWNLHTIKFPKDLKKQSPK